jgi:thioesterase domain-containing protein
VHALVLDELLQPQPPGVAGQLYLAGPALARGYLNRPDLSASSFVPHPYSNAPGQRMYASGDLVRQLADGNLAYLGRIDQQVKLRGLRIELGEIETILASWPWVREALVLVSGEAGQDRQIVAWLVLAAGRKLPPLAQLRENLLTLLPDYMVPSHFIALDAMPLTPNGKIDRNALPQPDLSRSDVPYQAPDSRTEILLAEIWGQLLQRQRISVHDDFFALGGHSLLAVQMVSLLQQQGGPAIPVREVFTHAVLAALAAHIDSLPGLPSAQQDQAGAVAGAGSALCLPVRPGSTSPPLFLIHPIGGEAAYAWALAPHLPAAMPVFALRARGLVAGETPHTSLPAMARDYLAQIRQIQPHGPYYLAGWSLGGNIAWEIAHQCRQAGQVVGFLGLIDSAPAAVLRQQLQAGGGHWDEEQAFWVWLSQQSGVTPAAIDTLQTLWQTGQDRQSGTPAFASLLAASQTQGLDLSPNLSRLAAALTPELVQAQVALYHASGLAILHWQQPGLDCALHLYCAGPDTQLAWASADGYDQIDCKLIGGDHFSIVQPPLLEQLGRAINCDLLARLQARPRANIKPSP